MDRRGGEYQGFPSKIFCLTVPKISAAESFIVALNSGTEKVWRRGVGREHQHSPSKFFCPRKPKNSVGQSFTVALISCSEKESFIVALNSGTEKVWRRGGGGSTNILRRNFFVPESRKTPLGNPLLLH